MNSTPLSPEAAVSLSRTPIEDLLIRIGGIGDIIKSRFRDLLQTSADVAAVPNASQGLEGGILSLIRQVGADVRLQRHGLHEMARLPYAFSRASNRWSGAASCPA